MSLQVDQRLPPAFLARLESETVRPVHVETFFSGKKVIVVGIPGAFTPVCTQKHLPQFIAGAQSVKASGYDEIVCIATCDPFSLHAWAKILDPTGRLVFLSDGNLDFTRKCGLITREEALFLGDRSKRYTLAVEDAVVKRMGVEQTVLEVSCTGLSDIVELT